MSVAERCTVRLLFVGDRPAWVRVYECDASGEAGLLKDLQPVREGADSYTTDERLREVIPARAWTCAFFDFFDPMPLIRRTSRNRDSRCIPLPMI